MDGTPYIFDLPSLPTESGNNNQLTHTHTHTHTRIIYIYICVCVYIYIYIYTNTCIHTPNAWRFWNWYPNGIWILFVGDEKALCTIVQLQHQPLEILTFKRWSPITMIFTHSPFIITPYFMLAHKGKRPGNRCAFSQHLKIIFWTGKPLFFHILFYVYPRPQANIWKITICLRGVNIIKYPL